MKRHCSAEAVIAMRVDHLGPLGHKREEKSIFNVVCFFACVAISPSA